MAQPLFGLIISGRPIQMLEPVGNDPSQGKFITAIPQAESVNHIVVFLSQPIPEGFGAGVYFSWPDAAADGGGQQWIFLGFLSNQKPSAIYKIVKPKKDDSTAGVPGQTTALTLFGGVPFSSVAQLGISVESLAGLSAMGNPSTEASNRSSNEEFCTKMLENFCNYAVSFSVSNPANPNESYVPLKVVTNWYETFKRKFAADPNFWK
ncbi:protein OPI10 homolog [Paramacrobiotus metropolitanus]|uniref:protein OPI10 homolog n=1 Tax=Paramacrobiotus metropolitanus TaxID=2943436 RepID=UPI002445C597|nr:protein OPI10 homolog [Paramacrobiotus metropolitanus]